MNDLDTSFAGCVARVKEILGRARRQALQTVNATMLAAYWQIGREIAQEEQRGQRRAEYGARLVEVLAERLTAEFGKGFSASNVKLIRQFYVTYADRAPPIGYTPSSESDPSGAAPAPESGLSRDPGFKPELSSVALPRADAGGAARGPRILRGGVCRVAVVRPRARTPDRVTPLREARALARPQRGCAT